MALLDDLLDWSKGRPAWQRDALRRLVQNSALSEADVDDLVNIAIAAYDDSHPAPEPHPLGPEHLPVRPLGAPPVSVASMRDIQNVNALVSGQTLPLGGRGLVVVYGDNGSGKSGYVRILKRVARARGARQPILPNVFSDSHEAPQSATIDYRVGDEDLAFAWSGDAEAPAELSQVSVFDSDAASVYVTPGQTVAYTPFGLDLLEKLVDSAEAVKQKLSALQDSDRSRLPSMPNGLATTDSGTWVSGLTERTTAEEIEARTAYPESMRERLTAVDNTLSEPDPIRHASELEIRASRYRSLVGSLAGLAKLFGQAGLASFKELWMRCGEARSLHEAAHAQFTENKPIRATGSETWRRLWEIAVQFAHEVADDVGGAEPTLWERCPLCQQALDGDARLRIGAFAAYILNRTTAEIAKAEEAFQETARNLRQAAVAPDAAGYRAALDDLRVDEPELEARITGWLRTVARVQSRVRGLTASTTDWVDSEPADDEFGAQQIESLAARLEATAEQLRASADPKAAASLRAERDGLAAQRWVSERRADIETEISRKQRMARRSAAIRDTSTNAITQQATRLGRTYITDLLAQRFKDELARLAGNTLKIQLTGTIGRQGAPRFEVTLHEPRVSVAVSRVVSEGELRAVALAAFLAEESFEESGSTIVVDDPVSSLDLGNRERFARRLVEVAAERQVIVFTHDVVFLLSLLEAAESRDVSVEAGMVLKTPAGTGMFTADVPREAKKAAKLLTDLNARCTEAGRLADDRDVEGYVRAVESLCTEFRKTIERCVEEVLLRGIVTRYSRPIRVNNVKQLAAVQRSDLELIDALMTEYSAFEHDQEGEMRVAPPDLAKVEADISRLQTWRQDIEKRVRNL